MVADLGATAAAIVAECVSLTIMASGAESSAEYSAQLQPP